MLLLNKTSLDKCLNNLKFATLGPYGTSSEFATLKLCENINCDKSNVILFNTYEEAFEDVKKNTSNAVIVANAYHGINNFYMDNKLELIATFIQNTPKYGIAVRKDFNIEELSNCKVIKIASHHAPTKKLDYYRDGVFKDKSFDITLFDSTSSAARSVKENEFDFCLTNENAVEMYGLKFISKLTDISMVWSIFGRVEILSNFIILNENRRLRNEMCNFN